jgi:hypothetical protein
VGNSVTVDDEEMKLNELVKQIEIDFVDVVVVVTLVVDDEMLKVEKIVSWIMEWKEWVDVGRKVNGDVHGMDIYYYFYYFYYFYCYYCYYYEY